MSIPALTALLILCGQTSAQFEVRLVAGGSRAVSIKAIAGDGALSLEGGARIAGSDWYSVRRLPGVLPPWPRSPHIELVGGDRIAGAMVGADGDSVRWLLPLRGPEQAIRLPISAVRVAWLVRGPDEDPAWLIATRKRDVIQTRNGDLTLGALTGMDEQRKTLQYQADGKDQQLALSRIAAIGFNTDLARLRRPKGVYYRVTLIDGTRLSAANVTFDGTTWTAQTLFKDTVRLPAERLTSIDMEQGGLTWLSTVKPVDYQYHSFDGEQHSWSVDRSVTGESLRLRTEHGESTFDRGIGLHAECAITYSLGGKYKRFEALAGLDARTGMKGDATILVKVDGKDQKLERKGRLTLIGGPIAINLDVTGAKELKIEIHRANGSNVQDHVNLVEARLMP